MTSETTNTNKTIHWYDILSPFASILAPYIAISTYLYFDPKISKFKDAVTLALNEYTGWSLAIAFAIELGYVIFRLIKHQTNKLNSLHDLMETKWSEHLDQDRSQIKEMFGSAEIVLKVDIEAFSNDHIKVVQEMLDNLCSVKSIYAIDASQPAQWWTNSMLGYLAIQARWKSYQIARQVHRLFVLNRGELSSLAGKKIIQFHLLMGFETYIVLDQVFDRIYKNYIHDNTDASIKKKEVLVWEDPLNNSTSVSIPEKFSQKRNKIYGYQSFWEADTDYTRRFSEPQFDIKGNEICLSDQTKYPVKFEYITNNYSKYAVEHLAFVKYLINGSLACKDEDDVEKIKFESDVVIRISSAAVMGGVEVESISIDNIARILDAYSEISNLRGVN